MTKQEFYKLFANEVGLTNTDINEETEFESMEEWDSWAVLVTMKMADESFNVNLTGDDFKKMKSLKDLMTQIGIQKFE